MLLAPGTRLGPYEILAPVGAGGMGEVYRARDTRLDRQVAVKVRRAEQGDTAEARARFEREARAISSLSHPHICALHDVGAVDGTEYLVMEWLEGQTLAERLRNGPLPVSSAIGFALQIAGGLSAAHGRGITHRDLKPGNVMITPSGVKLVDFGLAKGGPPGINPNDLQTVTGEGPLTAAGTWMGTAPYMSPEQFDGRSADTRSDVFAFGAVLYEMVTGHRAFTGNSASAIAAAVLHQEPPAAGTVVASIPSALDRLIRECLSKDPDRRWQAAHDVWLQLAAIDEAMRQPAAAQVISSRTRWLPWGVAAAAMIAAGVAWLGVGRGPSVVASRIELHVVPPPQQEFFYSVETVNIAVSPDGADLVFVAGDGTTAMLWRRALDSTDARPIPGTEGAAGPFWSPDGSSIGFFAGGILKRMDLATGVAVPICAVSRGIGLSGTWSESGRILFAAVSGDGIFRVSSAGGEAIAEVSVDQSASDARRVTFPAFLPGGERYLYRAILRDGSSWLMVGTTGGSPQRVMPVDSNVAYVDTGAIVFVRAGTLLTQPFDSVSATVSGESRPLATPVRFFATTGVATFSASRSGTVVYQSQRNRGRLAWIDRTGRELASVGSPGDYLNVRITPDGRSAFLSRALPSTGTFDIWSLDLERNTDTRLTLDDTLTETTGLPIPGGSQFVAGVSRSGAPRLERMTPGEPKGELLLPSAAAMQEANDVTPDGKTFVYAERTPAGQFNLWVLPLAAGATPKPLRPTPFTENGFRFSPDGRFYTVQSLESGRPEIYVASFDGGARTRISNGVASPARWSRDGREIFYLSADGRMMSLPVRTSSALELGTPVTLFAVTGRSWTDFDVAPDGKRFLAVLLEAVAGEQPLNAILNGFASAR